MSVALNPTSSAQGAPVPFPEYLRVCRERDHWKQKALAVQQQVSRLTTFAGCAKLTEGQRIRTWAALQIADASPADKDGWRRVNLFDVVTVAGINTTPEDDTPEARKRAIKNAASSASKAFTLAEELGVLERKEPVYYHDDPDDPHRITGSSAHVRLVMPAQDALQAIAVRADPRPAKKSRGIHVKPIACPNCGQTKHIHIKCSACGYYCTGQELAELEVQRLEQEQDEAEIPGLQILQPENVETTDVDGTLPSLLNLQPDVAVSAEASVPEPAKPHYLTVDVSGIPTRLMGRVQWVCWKAAFLDGRWTKVPYDAEAGFKADTKDSGTWRTCAQALARYRAGDYDGIGYVFSQDDPFAGVDFDVMDEAAWADIHELDSYTEQSPTGRGVHAIVEASKPGQRCRAGSVELYDQGRFFAMTGRRVDGSPPSIEARQTELDRVYNRLFPAPPPRSPAMSPAPTTDDAALIDKASKAKHPVPFEPLWRGEYSQFASGSESGRHIADHWLCRHLLFWTDRDVARTDRLFRQSGLMREKWDRPDGTYGTYGQRTIRKALGDA
jgi:putative DNA primase/helicase